MTTEATEKLPPSPENSEETAGAAGNDSASNSPPAELDINTDGRGKGRWKSCYQDPVAVKEIRIEAAFTAVVFIATLTLILATWKGWVFAVLVSHCVTDPHVIQRFNKFAYFFLGGQLGGIMFASKYLYKVVAHGYWHIDRRLWRVFSPFLSGGLALAIGAMLDSGVIGFTTKTTVGTGYLSIGFIAGYFADSALAKMQEVAGTIFGASKRA